jgi:hypothetical protein
VSLVGPSTSTLGLLSRCDNIFSFIRFLSLSSNSTSFSVHTLPSSAAYSIVLGFEIQLLVIIISLTDAEFGITIAAIPVTIIILIFCAWSVRHESVPGMVVTVFWFFGGLVYFLFKVIGPTVILANLIQASAYVRTISSL